KKIFDDPNRASFGFMDWGITFTAPDFVKPTTPYEFLIQFLTPPDVTQLSAKSNGTAFATAHFTRITGFGNISSGWGANTSGPGGGNLVPEASSSLLL